MKIQARFLWGTAADTYRASLLVRANSPMADTKTGLVVLPQTARIPIRDGTLDFTLPASDGPTLAEPFVYSVWEVMPGGRQYTISVPSGRGGAVQSLRSLRSSEPYQPIPVPRLNSSNWNWSYK
ncbi:hypothetical protein [Streptomyces sp. UNOC14_S4]|uniref:hypothetical protein n=1 Tax=Streptomyces sp. UNOC14_S4 TaxID=2872340 RepID=UPI001E5C600B|nr:hypothetical protein [Streptomyces sp. UNOC14_S4]MCC3766446.1 hypothetical protein [Streptomyces sp. UNOC14_S4]